MCHARWSLTALATLSAALLASCASAPDRAEIFISTIPPGASCTLTRLGQPIGTAEPTPAIALVEPSDSEITILCRRQGYADATATLAAPKAGLNLRPLLLGGARDNNQHRVDIALTAKRP